MAKGEKENGERWGRPIREAEQPPDFSGPSFLSRCWTAFEPQTGEGVGDPAEGGPTRNAEAPSTQTQSLPVPDGGADRVKTGPPGHRRPLRLSEKWLCRFWKKDAVCKCFARRTCRRGTDQNLIRTCGRKLCEAFSTDRGGRRYPGTPLCCFTIVNREKIS